MSIFASRRRYQDGDRIEVGGSAVLLRVSGRARRVSLRLDPAHRQVIATAPDARRLKDAAAFALERSGWIADRLAELPDVIPLRPGALIDVLGEPCRLEATTGRTQWRSAEPGLAQILAVDGRDSEAYARGVVRALKARALLVLRERTEFHAAALRQPMPSVSVIDPRARWGSCTPPRRSGFGAEAGVGRIRYSWRLVLAPFPVMDYVAAHECAHLIEANHSSRFWAVVHERVGDERPHRAWLREHGPRLHGFGRG